jgi:hypothetical protein
MIISGTGFAIAKRQDYLPLSATYQQKEHFLQKVLKNIVLL